MPNSINVPIKRLFVQQPLPVYYSVNPYLKEMDYKGIIEDYRKKYPKSSTSNVKCWHSEARAHTLEPRFLPLIKECEDFCYQLNKFPRSLMLADFWCMQYEAGNNDHAIPHCHWPATFSCIYYVDVGEGCSPLKFQDGTEIVPESGMVIAFDGNVVHEVPPTDAHRTCVAMNFSIKIDEDW